MILPGRRHDRHDRCGDQHHRSFLRTCRTATVPTVQFGKEVRRRRKADGMTIEELAERAGLSTNYVGAVERGDRDPSLSTVVALAKDGQLSGFNMNGTLLATGAGALGALGAICIIYAFRAGGTPLYVMPLVFGGAPLVNVLFTMATHPPKTAPNPMLYVGFVLAAVGAGIVLYHKPS